jgi:hypothetical protein
MFAGKVKISVAGMSLATGLPMSDAHMPRRAC